MLNNSWNKVIYKVWSPIYDKTFSASLFKSQEKYI